MGMVTHPAPSHRSKDISQRNPFHSISRPTLAYICIAASLLSYAIYASAVQHSRFSLAPYLNLLSGKNSSRYRSEIWKGEDWQLWDAKHSPTLNLTTDPKDAPSLPPATSKQGSRVSTTKSGKKSRPSRTSSSSTAPSPKKDVLQTVVPIKLKKPLTRNRSILASLPAAVSAPESSNSSAFRNATINWNTKYLTYLPHSGLHNQRISLENALLLAYMTNRTLIMPPVFLGRSAPWMPFDLLNAELADRTRLLAKCDRTGYPKSAKRCNVDFTDVGWEYLFDISQLKPYVSVIDRVKFNAAASTSKNGQRDAPGVGVHPRYIYYLKDTSKYHYRIYDTRSDPSKLGKYETRLLVDDLRSIDAPILHFGSLFSSSRISVKIKEYQVFKSLISRSLVYSNTAVLESAKVCIAKFGGLGSYVGIHVRVGDGVFHKERSSNVERIVMQLQGQLPISGARSISAKKSSRKIRKVGANLQQRQCPQRSEPLISGKETPLLSDSQANTIGHSVYLATDSLDPASSPDFQPLYAHNPCIFTLSDCYPDVADRMSAEKNPRHPSHPMRMQKFLVPMLDAVIASNGRTFLGTPGSTFSGYTARLHQVFARDGFSILPSSSTSSSSTSGSEIPLPLRKKLSPKYDILRPL